MDIAEKRVYDDATGTIAVAVAGDTGLAIAAISGDIVGEFGLALRRPIADLAVLPDGRLALATEEDVLVVPVPEPTASLAAVPEPIVTDRGAGTVVSATADRLIAAGHGEIASRPVETLDDPACDWTVHDAPAGTVQSSDGPLVATDGGVLRVDQTGLSTLGLDGARDVAAGRVTLAGTDHGAYRLDDEWHQQFDAATSVVTAGPERAHAVTANKVHAFDRTGWTDIDWPLDTPPVDLAYATPTTSDQPVTIALGETGTLLVDAGDGWRRRALGLRGVQACAVW
jgi:hypothetical protein